MVTLLQKKALQKNNAKGNNYKLEYNGINVNGEDTTKEYYYVQNKNCTSQVGGYGSQVPLEHFNNKSETYRIYSGVITYKNDGQHTEEQT